MRSRVPDTVGSGRLRDATPHSLFPPRALLHRLEHLAQKVPRSVRAPSPLLCCSRDFEQVCLRVSVSPAAQRGRAPSTRASCPGCFENEIECWSRGWQPAAQDAGGL